MFGQIRIGGHMFGLTRIGGNMFGQIRIGGNMFGRIRIGGKICLVAGLVFRICKCIENTMLNFKLGFTDFSKLFNLTQFTVVDTKFININIDGFFN